MRRIVLAIAIALLLPGSAFAGELLVNGGFETGSLSPWYNAINSCFGDCQPWQITTATVHSGQYAAMNVGNIELRQDFTPTPGPDVASVTFWVNSSAGFNAVDFYYTDGSNEEVVVSSNPGSWTYEDVTSAVDRSKRLDGFSIFGVSPGGITFFDDASIVGIPEPTSLALLCAGSLAGVVRRSLP